MSFRFRRTSVRLAVALVGAAIPLFGAGAAQAALGLSHGITSTTRPDLISASITSPNSATFCFDKPIASIADPGGFYVGGYRADKTSKSAGTSGTLPNPCVVVNIPTATADTFAQVGEGAVRAAGNVGNRADSAPLAGSNTGNGTRGLTTAPDLTGISTVAGATQQVAFQYDEAVLGSAITGNGGFHIVVSSGTPNCPAAAPACDVSSTSAAISATDPTVVIAQFPIGGSPLVTGAVRGYSLPGAVASYADGIPSTWDSAPAAGNAGLITGIPTLVSAQYSRQPATTTYPGSPAPGVPAGAACGTGAANNCVVVDYTFNDAVDINNTAASRAQYYAYLSDGSFIHPSFIAEPTGNYNAVGNYRGGTTGNVVRAYFDVPANAMDDYLVKAAVAGATTTGQLSTKNGGVPPAVIGCNGGQQGTGTTPPFCAAVNTTSQFPNTPASAPIGGNTGGKSTGYSTAPDALNATFDSQTNTASVTFDSRVFFPAAGAIGQPISTYANNFQLVGPNGDDISGATAASICSPSQPGFPCGVPTTAAADTSGPGPVTVYLQYPSPAAQVANAKGIEIRGYVGGSHPFGFAAAGGNVFNVTAGSPVGPPSAGNLQQIVGPNSVAARAHLSHLRSSNRWSHVRMTNKRLASVLKHTKHHTRSKHSR